MKAVEKIIGYKFYDITMLETAFTHSSYVNEHGGESNERLEFLGDSLLDFLVAAKLFDEYPIADEGELSEHRAALVSRAPLARIVDSLGLMKYLRVGAGVDIKSFSVKNRSNIFEAILGAVYLDGGIDECIALLDRIYYPNAVPEYDYKSVLQKKACWTDNIPLYSVEAGGDGFVATVTVGSFEYEGTGKTKHEAEIAAAHAACIDLYGIK